MGLLSGLFGSKSKPPAAPDPKMVAQAQTEQNRDAALYSTGLNRFNTYTPFGSQEFTTNGIDPVTGAPRYTQNINLDPQVEGLYRSQISQNQGLTDASGRLLSQLPSSPFSLSGLPGRSDLGSIRDEAQNSIYSRNTAFLDPQFKQGEDSLRSRLANQGIVEGSEAYKNAIDDFNRSKEFSYGQARDAAVAGGGAEADRAFGMDERLRNNMLSEMLMERNMPYQELAQLRGMTGEAPMPQFGQPFQTGTGPADIQGAYQQQYQGQLDAYNAKQQGKNNLMSGLFGLGSAAILASDERVKEDIEQIGELNDGTNVYLFRYKGSETPTVGVMAQEVEKRDPGAIHERGGVKHVNYARVLARALEAA